MILTKRVKEAVVKHIMQDVPKVDYRGQAEAKLRAAIKAAMPKEVADFAAGQHANRLEANIKRVVRPIGRSDLAIAVRGYNSSDDKIPDEALREVTELLVQNEQQDDMLEELNGKLTSAFASIRTRKQAVTAFPEFEKYLPAEDDKLANLPTTTGVVTSLMQAGWPKKKGAKK